MKYVLIFLMLPALALSQGAFKQAEIYFENDQFSKAKPLFESHLKKSPNDMKAIEYLGDIASHSKDWDTAIDYYETLLDRDPQSADYNFKYGGAMGLKAKEGSKLTALRLIGDVKKHFRIAAELDPKHIDVRWAMVELYMQLPAIIGGSEKKAIKYADELMKISPVDGYLSHGYIAEYNERPAEAEKFYKKAIEVGGSPHTYEKLTNLYENNNQPAAAIENAAISLQKHKRNSLNYQIGKISAQYNLKPEMGIKCLMEYIQNFSVRDGVPKDWAYFRLAQIYKNQGDKNTALKWIDKALRDRPDFKEALEEKRNILSL